MKLAMIGSYGHYNFVLDSLDDLPDVELVAAAKYGPQDPLPYVGKHAATSHMPIYADYREMLDEIQPDIVAVFMPLYRNAEASLEAAMRGCHIMSEKPLATELDDLYRLRETAARCGVQVGALFNLRGAPAFQAARQAVQQGLIGQPVLACGQKSYPFSRRDDFYKRRETYGGSIPWCAIHAIDFISYCSGKDYVRVAAMHSNAGHPSHQGMEDNGGLLLQFAGGGTAVIWFDYFRPWAGAPGRSWGDDRLRIVGTAGQVEVIEEGRKAVLMTASSVEYLPLPPVRDVFGEFVAAVKGQGTGLIPTDEAFRATEVALRARQAADSLTVLEL